MVPSSFRYFAGIVICLGTVSLALAQEPNNLLFTPPPKASSPGDALAESASGVAESNGSASVAETNGVFADDCWGGFLSSDRGFPNFIGFISNPTRNFDPRSLTQLWPLFTYSWTDPFRIIPSGQLSAYGAGFSAAVTDRLCIGLSSGGPAWAHFNRQRTGWLDLSGFVQYTIIRNTDRQFLLTGGLIWTAPSGSKELFQGSPPAYLAPYLTLGKEFGNFHVLATTGYNFAAESAVFTVNTYYANFHFDYRVAGWFYPLVEFNGSWSNHTLDLTLTNAPGLIELDRFDSTGGSFTVAPGFNAVLIPDRLELGAVYETPIWSQRGFNFNSLLVKMIVRF